MSECCELSYVVDCFLGGGPGAELITRPGRISMSLCDQKNLNVIQSLKNPLMTCRRTVGPCGTCRVKVSTKGRVKLNKREKEREREREREVPI